MPIIAGNLRKTISIFRYSVLRDAFGATKDTYTNVMTIKAGIKKEAGSLGMNNYEIFNSQIFTFITYYRTIYTNDRIQYNNQMYKILNITEIGYRESLEITVELINA